MRHARRATRFVRLPAPYRRVLAVYAGLCLVLWAVPLLNLLHVESSAVVAGVAYGAAGVSSVTLFRRGAAFGSVLLRQEGALVVPWALLTVTLLWTPNCGYVQGLAFFVLFAPVSVVLAVAIGYLVSGTRLRRPRTVVVLLGLVLAVGGTLYDLGLHPQFYTYNHVFGGVLGPIYDEELTIRPGLVAFRVVTLGWAGLAGLAGRRMRRRNAHAAGPARWELPLVGGLAVLVGAAYAFAAPLGITTTPGYLHKALGGVHQTPHFALYYDPAVVDSTDLRLLADAHEYRYARLAEQLGVDVPEQIASYVYPDAETRARLTGARFTSVAPVWLRRPQVHVLHETFEQVFPHELAHVFGREFGLPVVRASLAVGLVEGLAVALEPPDGLPTPHEQVAAAAAQQFARSGVFPDLAGPLTTRLSPLGFWTGRGAVSYTTMGSFVRYLLDTYGPGPLRRVYPQADFEAAYGRSMYALAEEWEAFLRRLPVIDRSAGALATRRFSVPSLFEKRCPHYVPAYRRRYREGQEALAAGDSLRALERFDASLVRQPAYVPALAAWAGLTLATGDAAAVAARLDTLTEDRPFPILAVRLADAYALEGRPDAARRLYRQALDGVPGHAYEQAALLLLRQTLAPRPDVLRIVVRGGAPEAQADALHALRAESPTAGVYGALFQGAAGAYDAAAAALQAAPPVHDDAWSLADRATLDRQRDVWLVHLYERAGRYAQAARTAAAAAEAYREAGAFNKANALTDRAERMTWLAARADPPPRVTP